MTPDQWLEEHYLKEIFSGEFEHLKQLVDELELSPNCQVVTIAGTNGKGETSRSLEYLLRLAGKKTALNTSPHLVCVNERFLFSGKQIDDSELLNVFESLQRRLSRRISYFEFLFLSFLELVKRSSVDVIILEVGLGGRLDATNVIDADFAAITSISRDHQDLLGNRYEQILKEKAGITRSQQQVFTSFTLDYLNLKMGQIQREVGFNWYPLDSKDLDFSRSNQNLALKIAESIVGEKLQVAPFNFARRYEWEQGAAHFDFYPSHNPEGIRKLFQFLDSSKYNNYDYLIISFSERPWSDLNTMMEQASRKFRSDQIYYYRFEHYKALKEVKRLKLKEKFDFPILDRETFKASDFKGRVLVTGSNYFIGHFINAFTRS